MKKYIFLSVALMCFVGGTILAEQSKLIHNATGKTVVEFRGEHTFFYDRFLKETMIVEGIPIPAFLRDEYGGKQRVFLDDEDFQKAFKEIFYPSAMASDNYHWEESET